MGKELGMGWWHPWGGGVAASSPGRSLIPLPIKRRQFASRNIPELFLLRTWVKKISWSESSSRPGLADLVPSPERSHLMSPQQTQGPSKAGLQQNT